MRVTRAGRVRMKRENVLVGALILSVSSIFVRMIGFVFRVYLSNTLGAEGMGVYSLIMSLYMVCANIATSGISGGVSKLVAEEMLRGSVANARRILRRSVSLSLALSVSVGVLLFVFADQVAAHILSDARTALSLRLLAPGLPLMSVSSCLRGYFIAARRVGNPATSQVLEQVFKIIFIMALIGSWMPKGLEYGCALVILGITLGEVLCFGYSLLGYLLEKRRVKAAGRAAIKGVTGKLLGFAIPVSVGSYVRSGLRLVEDLLIVSGLKTYTGQEDAATGTYGMLRGMVMPLLLFPLQLLSSFVIMLMPEVSRLNAAQNSEKLTKSISKILQYTSVMGILIVSVFMTFSYELGVAVYGQGQVGEMLRLLSFLCPLMCIEMVVVSILQGLGEQVSSLRYNVTDCILRVAMVFFLVPRWGVSGFLWMVVVSNLYTALLNLRRLLTLTRVPLEPGEWILRPALAAMAASQCGRALCNLYLFKALPMWQGLAFGIAVVSLFYLLALLGIGSVHLSDFAWIMKRLHLSRKRAEVALEQVV